MEPLTAASSLALQSLLARLLPDVDVVSFDVFDTLVGRRIAPPDQVKRLAASLAVRLIAPFGITAGIDQLLELRDRVEDRLRREAQLRGGDTECSFSAIATEMATRLNVDAAMDNDIGDVCKAIIDAEVTAELGVLFVKPGIANLLVWLRAQGKRAIAVSDMYLDGAVLREILTALGIGTHLEALFVSADYGVGKHTGRLFQRVVELSQVAPGRIVHIGDNRHSDVQMAAACGIRTIHLHERHLQRQQHEFQAIRWLSQRNPFWRGHHVSAMVPRAQFEDFFERYGHEQLGPIYATFVARTIEYLDSVRPREVYFLARDGHLFQQIYETFRKDHRPELPPSRYLYVSRRSVALPGSWNGISVERLLPLVFYHCQRGFATIARGLGIPADLFADTAQRFGLAGIDAPFSGWTRKDVERLAADSKFQAIIIARANFERERLRQYLAQEGFFGSGIVALVDIGWSGSIQKAITDAFGSDADFPEVRGYYLSYNDAFQYSFGDHEATGVLFDTRRMHPDHNVFVHFEEIFENGARASHGTTEGYVVDPAGRVHPKLRSTSETDRSLEQAFDASVEALRRGALEYARAFATAFSVSGYRASDLIPYAARHAERLVVYPTREEVRHLSSIVHTEDAGTDNILDFSKYSLTGPHAILRPRRFLASLRHSHWSFGTARSSGLPGINHAMRLFQRYRIRRDARTQGRSLAALLSMPRPKWWEGALLTAVRLGALPYLTRLRALRGKGNGLN